LDTKLSLRRSASGDEGREVQGQFAGRRPIFAIDAVLQRGRGQASASIRPAVETGHDIDALREYGAVGVLVHEGPTPGSRAFVRSGGTSSREGYGVACRGISRCVRPSRENRPQREVHQVPAQQADVLAFVCKDAGRIEQSSERSGGASSKDLA